MPASAGPTAEPTAIVLIKSAAKAATSVRVNFDFDDIFNLPFGGRLDSCAVRCPFPIKSRANPANPPKTPLANAKVGFSAAQILATFATLAALRLGTAT